MFKNVGELISLLIFNFDKVKSRYFNYCRALVLLLMVVFSFILFIILQKPLNWTSILFYFLILIFLILTQNQIEKFLIKLKIDRELTRANLYLSKIDENTVLTPPIDVKFHREKPIIEVSFTSSLKNYERLATLDFGAVLHYNQINKWQSSRNNQITYQLEQKIDRQFEIDEFTEFVEDYPNIKNPNILLIDKITNIPVCHTFLVGSTGSGKTVALSFLLKQLVFKANKTQIFIIDRKKSDLYLLQKKLYKEYKYIFMENSKEGILAMSRRALEILDYRRNNLIRDGKKRKFPIFLVVIDEYISLYQSFDKNEREEIKRMITELLVIGRELNCHLWLSQQSPTVESSGLSTYLKNQFLVNIFLRPSMTNKIALETMFGKGVITNPFVVSFGVGEGLCQNLILSDENRTSIPRMIAFPPPFEDY